MRSLRNHTRYLIVLALAGLAGVAALFGSFSHRPATTTRQQPDAAMKAQVSAAYHQLPMHFEINRGQADAQVEFLARGDGYSLFLTADGAVLALRKSSDSSSPVSHAQSAVVRMKLVGAQAQPHAAGLNKLPGKINYLIGNDPRRWRTDVPTYARVKYQNVYPGVDLIYYGNQRQLEYDFVVAPGADSAAIALRFEGANKIEVDAQGDLVLHTPGGQVRQRKPCIYQEANGVRQEIAGGYVLKDEHQVSFQLGAYDATRPLVIDPALLYSTYLGGNGDEDTSDIALDGSGKVYVTGSTNSSTFPFSITASLGVGGGKEAFVAKMDLSQAGIVSLIFFTYFGGSGDDEGVGVAVNPNCNANCQAYVTGATRSSNFPTHKAFQANFGRGDPSPGILDAFATVLNATGNNLDYSTYIGGSAMGAPAGQGIDEGLGIAVDGLGIGYVTGQTHTADFPITPSAFQLTNANPGGPDAFVTKFDPSQTGVASLLYSTYLGGRDHSSGGAFGDFGQRIAVDGSGNAYVTGITGSDNFPTMIALQAIYGGGISDAFVTRIDTSQAGAASLVYSTFLGGNDREHGGGIAVDASGVYVTGNSSSSGFPVSPPAPPPLVFGLRSSDDVFVAKLNPTGSALLYFVYLAGGSDERGQDLVVDGSGNVYVTGFVSSNNFPTINAFQSSLGGGGGNDAFVAKLRPNGDVAYSSYLGGSLLDVGRGIAVDSAGNVCVTGNTRSTDFPISANAFQPNIQGPSDAFVAKIGEAPDLAITKTGSPNPVVAGSNVTYTITLTNNGPNAASSVVVTDNLPAATTFVSCATTGGGVCGGSGNNRTVTFASLAAGASATITLVATVNCSVVDGTAIGNTATVSSATLDPNPSNNSATAMTTASNPPPVITCPTTTICVTATPGQTSTVVTYATPTATDNCPGQPTVTCSPPSGSSFPLGLTTVTCTATDVAGNMASCSFTVALNGTLFANRDSYLRGRPANATNLNEGFNERLQIKRNGPDRAIVAFDDLAGIPRAGLKSASLVLYIAANDNNWGATGRLVDAHRLLVNWTEGNGRNEIFVGGGSANPGTGAGATWNCASDSNISNNQANCTPQWNGAINSIAMATAPGVLHTNNLAGNVSWNVTTDVINGANFGWLIKKRIESQNGQAQYHSRQGAAGNPNLVPRLVLVYCP